MLQLSPALDRMLLRQELRRPDGRDRLRDLRPHGALRERSDRLVAWIRRRALFPGADATPDCARRGGPVPGEPSGASPEPSAGRRLRVFAAGLWRRDHAMLARAVAGEAFELTVVCDRQDGPGRVRAGSGLRVLRCCYDESVLDELRRADVVAIPLAVDDSLAGQALLMQAMAYAKPIVVMRTPVAAEYVTDEIDALLVAPGSAGAMRDALLRLHRDPALRARLGRAARSAYVADLPQAAKVDPRGIDA